MSLSGLIKALRNNKHNEQEVVQTALAEVAVEVKSTDWDTKAAAVLKLIYLEMLGYPAILTYSFNVLECMASPRYHIKSIGYLAAAQSFGASTEVILLANNLIKKDLQSSSDPSTVVLALTSLPALLVASPQLAEDLLPELLRMLTHSKPQVKRIATLTIGKIWCTSYVYASPLPTIEFSHIEKLRSGLNDDDSSVVSATVNVMLELARSRKDALQKLLGLAPELFDLLTNSTNNWMLIKVAKLFSFLTPIEPRLIRKLLPPLTNLISTTPAFSLLYECIQTVITGGMLNQTDATASLAQSCIDKLSSFLSDKDQNLRYIALKGLSRLLQNAPHTTSLLARYYDDILTCITEEDLTIRLKALELVERLTDKSNCKTIVSELLHQVAPSSPLHPAKPTATNGLPQTGLRSAAGALRAISSAYDASSPSGLPASSSTANASSSVISHYRYRLLLLVLRLTNRSSEDGSQLYVNITDFEWYVDILFECAYLSLSVLPTVDATDSARLARRISESLLDIVGRAALVRPFAVKRCRRLLADQTFIALDNPVVSSLTSASSFILGEYGQPKLSGENIDVLLSSIMSGSRAIGVCLGVMQCVAGWLRDMAEHWQEQYTSQAKLALNSICVAMKDIETDEADLCMEILKIVISGLNDAQPDSTGRIPPSVREASTSVNSTSAQHPSNPFASHDNSESVETYGQERNPPIEPPKVLALLHSIMAGYELRPLAANAQALVSPPVDLDLEMPLGLGAVGLASTVDARPRGTLGVQASAQDVDEYGRKKSSTSSGDATKEASKEFDIARRARRKGKDGGSKERRMRRKDVEGKLSMDELDVESIPIMQLELSDHEKEPADRSARLQSPLDLRGFRAAEGRASKIGSPPPIPIILAAGGEAPRAAPVREAVAAQGRQSPEPPSHEGSQTIARTEATVQDSATVKIVKKKRRKIARDAGLGESSAQIPEMQ